MEQAVLELKAEIGERHACNQMAVARASFQRHQKRSLPYVESIPAADEPEPLIIVAAITEAMPSRAARRQDARNSGKRPRFCARALTLFECQELLDVVHHARFVDHSVSYIYATLLDENRYYGSISTMYRVLRSVGEVGDRRDQATRPAHVKPELCATAPNQVYAWDITKLHGPQKWTYYYLYAVVDIYSRYVVGWLIADRESSELAKVLLETTIRQQGADPKKLTIQADRGSSMTSKPLAFLLADLGVTKSHSRPHVSNDNPHIESLFKTTKYQPEFPKTFANIVEARMFCFAFFHWYNYDHRHSGIALLTPSDVHHGRVEAKQTSRQNSLDAAYAAHPERFVKGRPKPPQFAPASYINRPSTDVGNQSQAE